MNLKVCFRAGLFIKILDMKSETNVYNLFITTNQGSKVAFILTCLKYASYLNYKPSMNLFNTYVTVIGKIKMKIKPIGCVCQFFLNSGLFFNM